MRILYILFFALILLGCNSSNSQYDFVNIGNQKWMKRNLNVSLFRNGDPIPEIKTIDDWAKANENKQPAWCYYNNDPANGEKYGKLYNFYAVNDPRGLAPQGWHIPTTAEWGILINLLGGQDVAGKKMKSKIGWNNDGEGTNESNFSALPSGYYSIDSSFLKIGSFSGWWTSTEERDYSAMSCYIFDNFEFAYFDSYYKSGGLSVRCIKD
jgi:uncharacterized protein (TIGR02145 family)